MGSPLKKKHTQLLRQPKGLCEGILMNERGTEGVVGLWSAIASAVPLCLFFKATFEARKRVTKRKFKTNDAFACSLAELGKRTLKSRFSRQVANTAHAITRRERKNLLCSVNEDYVSL